MILQIVTNIDKRIEIMESTMIKSVDDLKKEILSVSGKVRKLENLSTDLTVKVTECESSCQGVSNLFDFKCCIASCLLYGLYITVGYYEEVSRW